MDIHRKLRRNTKRRVVLLCDFHKIVYRVCEEGNEDEDGSEYASLKMVKLCLMILFFMAASTGKFKLHQLKLGLTGVVCCFVFFEANY